MSVCLESFNLAFLYKLCWDYIERCYEVTEKVVKNLRGSE